MIRNRLDRLFVGLLSYQRKDTRIERHVWTDMRIARFVSFFFFVSSQSFFTQFYHEEQKACYEIEVFNKDQIKVRVNISSEKTRLYYLIF